jgi:surface-anchored protein
MMRQFACCAAIVALFVVFVQTAPADEPHYYTAGHADLGLGDEDELELHLHCHEHATVDGVMLDDAEEYNPADAVIVVPESTKNYLHDQGGADAVTAAKLSLSEGADYWFLPDIVSLASQLNAPHFGLGAEDVYTGVFDDDMLNLTLKAMPVSPEGGQFAMSYLGDWLMTTADGISENDTYQGIPVGFHDHPKWMFTKPGTYQLTFEASAYQGGTLVTNVNTFTFQVVPEPGILVLLVSAIGFGVGMMALRRRRQRA